MFGRSAHSPIGRLPFGKALAGGFMLVLFGFSLALASSPVLHKLAHDDANQDGHRCAATLLLSGGNDVPHDAVPALLPPPAAPEAPRISAVLLLPVFLTAYLHEHSPPSAS